MDGYYKGIKFLLHVNFENLHEYDQINYKHEIDITSSNAKLSYCYPNGEVFHSKPEYIVRNEISQHTLIDVLTLYLNDILPCLPEKVSNVFGLNTSDVYQLNMIKKRLLEILSEPNGKKRLRKSIKEETYIYLLSEKGENFAFVKNSTISWNWFHEVQILPVIIVELNYFLKYVKKFDLLVLNVYIKRKNNGLSIHTPEDIAHSEECSDLIWFWTEEFQLFVMKRYDLNDEKFENLPMNSNYDECQFESLCLGYIQGILPLMEKREKEHYDELDYEQGEIFQKIFNN
jgi:hypothetical protein